jgi:hypothetical protein
MAAEANNAMAEQVAGPASLASARAIHVTARFAPPAPASVQAWTEPGPAAGGERRSPPPGYCLRMGSACARPDATTMDATG